MYVCNFLGVGIYALILPGRAVILLLLRSPSVSTLTKGVFVSSSLAFCDVDNDSGTVARLGGMGDGASVGIDEEELWASSLEAEPIGGGCVLGTMAPSEDVVNVGDC